MKQRWIFIAAAAFVAIALAVLVSIHISPATSRFASLADAKASGLIEKGWIPALIPQDAYDIIERHDIDSNEGAVEFSYQASAWVDQIASRMRELPSEDRGRFIAQVKEASWHFQGGASNKYFQSEKSSDFNLLAINPSQKRAVFLRIADRR